MKYKIEKLDHEGRGIIRDGKIIFVKNALPLETVEIKILKEKKKFIEAESISIENPSNDRCIPNCRYYNGCGGCNLLHMNYDGTLAFKENKVKEIMDKFLGEKVKINNIIYSEKNWNYRNKATFHVNQKIGYYKEDSNSIIGIDQCNILDEKINEILDSLKLLSLNNIYEIIIRKSKYTSDSMVIFKIYESINEQKIIDILKDKVTSIILYENKKYKTIYGSSTMVERMDNFMFQMSEDSFFQVNTEVAILLYKKVLEYISPTKEDDILDLYCGTGTIGIFMSKYCRKVTGIEINESAIINAKKNATINEVSNIEFICKDSSKAVLELGKNYNKIIVDPPRAGLDKNTIQFLKKSEADKIVYVSCDPVTLARDLKELNGIYKIVEITPVDMFPHTHHVECVCLLKRS